MFWPKYSGKSRNELIAIKLKLDMIRDPDDCWTGIGYVLPRSKKGNSYCGGGYCGLSLPTGKRGGEPSYAHRLSYEYHFGEIPNGIQVMHKCNNRQCFNPSHLELGTAVDNMQYCKKCERQGDNKGIKNYRTKLTNEDIINIRNSNLSQEKLSEIYGIKSPQISKIINRKAWKHI